MTAHLVSASERLASYFVFFRWYSYADAHRNRQDRRDGVRDSMESPKRKRISDVKAGVLMIDQVKPAVLEGTAVRFDLSKGEGIK